MRLHPRLIIAALSSLVLALVSPVPAQAHDDHHGHHAHHRELTVMTQNLYLGSSLAPALAATTPRAFVEAVAQIYGTAVFTDFPRRAEAIADTIAAEDPDLIGLQEVTRWTALPMKTGPAPPSYDFLKILQTELTARGLDYRVASVSENADIGPAPLVAPGFGCLPPASVTATPDCVVTLQDRDVILVDASTHHLQVRRAANGDYVAQEVLTLPGGVTESFARGWASVDLSFHGKKLRFLTTHLEVEDFAATQEAQAREFLAGPARAPGAVVATGDFNSAADPATTTTPTTSYADLTRRWFDDAWWRVGGTGATCCQNSSLSNPVSQLRTRIDLVLTHGPVRARTADVVGDTRIPGGLPPFWASDHAGVVATLRLH